MLLLRRKSGRPCLCPGVQRHRTPQRDTVDHKEMQNDDMESNCKDVKQPQRRTELQKKLHMGAKTYNIRKETEIITKRCTRPHTHTHKILDYDYTDAQSMSVSRGSKTYNSTKEIRSKEIKSTTKRCKETSPRHIMTTQRLKTTTNRYKTTKRRHKLLQRDTK